jgi:hypothetical protein
MNHWGSAEASSFCVSPNTFLLSILISGCTTTGPSPESPEFRNAVQSVIPPEKIVLARKGGWLPNQFGYNQIPITIFEPSPTIVPGVFAMTDKDVFFLVYHKDSSKFVKALNIGIDEINQALTDTFANSMRLVLVSNKRVNSFELAGSGGFIDKSITQEIAKRISEKK